MYIYITDSLWCIPKTNMTWYINYISIKLKKKKHRQKHSKVLSVIYIFSNYIAIDKVLTFSSDLRVVCSV